MCASGTAAPPPSASRSTPRPAHCARRASPGSSPRRSRPAQPPGPSWTRRRLAREIRSSGAAVTIVAHEHKRLGRGIEPAAPAEQLRAAGIGLEFLTGELQGSHDPSGVVFTVLAALSGMEREYIRDRTLEGHESARARDKAIGGPAVTGYAMLAVALHLRGQQLSLRDIAARLVIATGKKKGQHGVGPATEPFRPLRRFGEVRTGGCGVVSVHSGSGAARV
jgi:Resolvase, N terminal domain